MKESLEVTLERADRKIDALEERDPQKKKEQRESREMTNFSLTLMATIAVILTIVSAIILYKEYSHIPKPFPGGSEKEETTPDTSGVFRLLGWILRIRPAFSSRKTSLETSSITPALSHQD